MVVWQHCIPTGKQWFVTGFKMSYKSTNHGLGFSPFFWGHLDLKTGVDSGWKMKSLYWHFRKARSLPTTFFRQPEGITPPPLLQKKTEREQNRKRMVLFKKKKKQKRPCASSEEKRKQRCACA